MATLLTAIVVSAAPPGGTAAAASGFRSLSAPQRLLDTRAGQTTADGQFAGRGARAAGSTLALQVGGRVGLPTDAAAVVLNVTVTSPGAAGFVTAYPCDQKRPTASNLNYTAGQTVPNAVISAVSGDGTVCLYTLARAELIVDASGWFPAGAFTPLARPQRLLDTRRGQPTADKRFSGTGTRPGRSVLELPVAGRAGVPGDATAVAMNVTVTGPGGPGYVTVFPCGSATPTASNVNYTAGQTVPNLVISRLGPDGSVCLYTHDTTELIVDVAGMLPADTFRPLAQPQRLLDTRPGQPTGDGSFSGAGAQPGTGTVQLRAAGRVGIPAEASAVILNVTAVPAGLGYVTVHPRGTSLPNASNLNTAPGNVVANAVIARVGRGGDICVYTSGTSDLIVDVAGWLTGPAPATTGGQCTSLTPTNDGTRNELLARPALHVATGTDRIAVLACDIDGDAAADPVDVASWANAEVAPYFASTSRGAYTAAFEAHPARRISVSDQSDCILAGRDITGPPFTNVMVYDSSDYGGGQGGPGYVTGQNIAALSWSPADSFRGFWIGGAAALYDPSVVIHEVGHTLHWPHSYIGPNWEYDNPIDIMSGSPDAGFDGDLDDYCPAKGGGFIWCEPQHTLAFNRLASGWMSGRQVAIHRSGNVNYTLGAPAGSGLQMVAMPDPAAPLSSLVIEARPATGYDRYNEVAGVALHLVDQGSGSLGEVSVNRRQRQATGAPESYDHVVEVGDSITLHGVTIRVLQATDTGYVVTVRGTYRRASDVLTQSFDLTQPSDRAPASCVTLTSSVRTECPR
jgi:M6 family metalloprotease-like protein